MSVKLAIELENIRITVEGGFVGASGRFPSVDRLSIDDAGRRETRLVCTIGGSG